MFTLRNLKMTGYIEGASMLLLVGVAMPVKYWLEEPRMVSIVGMIHGLLFIWYVIFLALTASRNPLPWWATPAGFVGAVIPFGPFIFEYLLAKSTSTRVSS